MIRADVPQMGFFLFHSSGIFLREQFCARSVSLQFLKMKCIRLFLQTRCLFLVMLWQLVHQVEKVCVICVNGF